MFGVVIPVYNSEKTICTVLDSVLSQTRFDLIDEIILVNDGSTDNSDMVIQSYIDSHSGVKFKYIKQENSGVSRARNVGIWASESEWIALLDSDDVWLPNKIEKQYECIKNNPEIKFLGSEYPLKILFGVKTGLYKLSAKELCIRSMPTTPSVVFERKTGLELGLYNEKMSYCEDINFFQKFLKLDSYYILAESLVNIGIEKEFSNQSGLSSNLKKMHYGRKQNCRELYENGLIRLPFYLFITVFNEIKYLRRVIINKLETKNSEKNRSDII